MIRALPADLAGSQEWLEAACWTLVNLDKDREFLKVGGVFDDDFIDSFIDLKMTEVIRFEHTPHPVEFDMYYSA